MSDAVLITPRVFNFVLRDPGQATVSQTERPRSEEATLRERCTALTEAERSLKAQLAKEQERFKTLRQSFERALAEKTEATEQTARRELVALGVRLAEVIVRRQLPDREMIRDVIQRTLAPLGDVRGARVRLNPVDAKGLAAEQAQGQPGDLIGRVEIIADPSLKPGDVTLETPGGYFDARLAERLRLLEERLAERAREAGGPANGGAGAGKPGTPGT